MTDAFILGYLIVSVLVGGVITYFTKVERGDDWDAMDNITAVFVTLLWPVFIYLVLVQARREK